MRILTLLIVLPPIFTNAQQDYRALIQTNCVDYAADRNVLSPL